MNIKVGSVLICVFLVGCRQAEPPKITRQSIQVQVKQCHIYPLPDTDLPFNTRLNERCINLAYAMAALYAEEHPDLYGGSK